MTKRMFFRCLSFAILAVDRHTCNVVRGTTAVRREQLFDLKRRRIFSNATSIDTLLSDCSR